MTCCNGPGLDDWDMSYDWGRDCPGLPGIPHGAMLTDGAEWRCYRCNAIPALPVQGCWPRYEGRDNPHPCYLGASYLNCGWAWLYECQAYPDTGSERCGVFAAWPKSARFPHLCTGWEVLPTATYDGKATLGLCWVKP